MSGHHDTWAGAETLVHEDSACSREPIHTPGAIQPHGALLAAQAEGGLVTHASANLRDILGHDAAAALGRPLSEIFEEATSLALMSASHNAEASAIIHMLTLADGRTLQLRAYRSDGLICVDIEPARSDPGQASALNQVQSVWDSFKGAANCLELCELAVRGLKQISGYDRVMAYRFASEGYGEVVAEALEPQLTPYLGLHYPAGDVPAQARRLFLRQRVGAIADSSYTPVPILADAGLNEATPLDLTLSGLRSVSAVHCEYMRNMQTAASLTVALVHEDALWGMLVCHHARPKIAGPELREVADWIGKIVSSRLLALSEAELAAGLAARKATLEALRLGMAAPLPLAEILAGAAPDLLALVGAAGAVIRCGGRVFCLGETPSQDAAERALGVLQPLTGASIFAVDDLGLRYPDLAACAMLGSGALLLSLPSAPEDAILWFRPELSRTVLWGGNPALHNNEAAPGEGFTPRKSFEAWKEIVSGRSSPWTLADLRLAGELRDMIARETGELARAELLRLRVELAARHALQADGPAPRAGHASLDDALHLLLFDAAPDAMVVVNGAGEIRLINLQAEKDFGYQGHEMIGLPVDMLIPERLRPKFPPNRQQPGAGPRVRMILGGIEPFGRRKDGSEFPVEIAMSDFATPEGLLVTVAIRNISIRKNAETQMARIDRQNRDLLEASPDVMVMFKASGEIVLLNLQAAAQFGYRRHELAGRSIETIIPHGIMAHADLVAAQNRASGRATSFPVPIELAGLRKNRSQFPAEITLGLAASGGEEFFTAAIRDITLRKELESLAQQSVEELKRSNEDLEQFAIVASHDLQEPLRMVISYTQLLSRRYKGKLDADADDFIAYAVDGGLRMQQLIRDLLAYCKVETTASPLLAAPGDDALRIALSNLGELIETSGAVVTAGPLPEVMADTPQLARVFQNLIANAIKYNGAGPRVDISAERMATGKWLFSVRDNGIGIEPRHFERIFGMFKRLHQRDEFSGTGIGLAICKKIIEHHQGTISVKSQTGEGSVFQFTLLPAGAAL